MLKLFISSYSISLIMISFILLPGCGILSKTTNKGFTDGYYTQRVENNKQKVYIDIAEDSIQIYQSGIDDSDRSIDSTFGIQSYPDIMKIQSNKTVVLTKHSFDLDFLTIPLKIRPERFDVPTQLNANVNGAVYLGYRTDKYILNYRANPLGRANRNINHFGFSIGTFTGFGNTAMSPTNTNNELLQEYDGIVWSKGIAGIFAINNSTVGIAFGFDNLLDKNKKIWIYESKPWLGLAIGLNLN